MTKFLFPFIFSILILPSINAGDENLQFPDDLPGPKELMDTFFRPMEPLNFTITSFFTITQRGKDCRHYQWDEQGIEFTVCIQNRQENGHWVQRVITFFPANLPINIIIEHTETQAISHEDLWNWRFPLPQGDYYSFNVPILGLSTHYEKKLTGVSFKMTFAQEDFSFLETAASTNKITRVYRGSFFDNISECQTTVIRNNNAQSTYYQIDQSPAMAPYLFRQRCLTDLIEQFAKGGEHFLEQFKKHVSVD